jgi:phosphotriesterase-related protein
MWNPQTYHDDDFGLDEGETFEPEQGGEEAVEVSTDGPHIMTLLGPIEPEELGVCLPHVHLLCDPPGADEDHRLLDPERTESEVEAFITMNGRSLVECTTRDCGRNSSGMLDIAQWVPAHLIAVTGRKNHPYASLMDNAGDEESLVEEFVHDLTLGMDGTDARAGVIKVGTSLNGITDVERITLQAAGKAHRRTGASITTHTENGTMALEILECLGANDVPANRVIIGHMDREPMAMETHLEVLKSGAFVQFDQIGKSDTYTDQQRADRIAELYRAGYGSQLLLSLDYGRKSLLTAYDGAPGLPYLSEWFMVLLMESGLEALQVRELAIDNPARALTIHPPASAQ